MCTSFRLQPSLFTRQISLSNKFTRPSIIFASEPTSSENKPSTTTSPVASAASTDSSIPTEVEAVDIYANETPEEKYKREKLAEIAERKAAEVFMVRDTGKYECQSCGYTYDVAVGMPNKGIAANTPWDAIEKLRCPQCGASKKYFVAQTEEISGFKENLKFGLGGNSLTAGQKSNLIFGGLFLGFLVFMSGYLLE
jgi:rubredoxin